MISESLGQWIRLLRSGWSVGSRSTSRNFSPADSCTSSTRASSNQSNQIPPHPPAHTSTVTPSALIVVMVLEHTGHSMMRSSLASGSGVVSVSLAISVLSGPTSPAHPTLYPHHEPTFRRVQSGYMCGRNIVSQINYPRRYTGADHQKHRQDDAHHPPDGRGPARCLRGP